MTGAFPLHHMTGAVTHVGLAAVGPASVVAHFGRLHGLAQGDGVGLVLFIHILAVIVLRLAVLKSKRGRYGNANRIRGDLQDPRPRFDSGSLPFVFISTDKSIYLLKTKGIPE